jgi:uncharacterized protein
MDVSRDSAPSWMWLEADRLVADALADLEKGKRVSVPSKRYKVMAGLARYTPPTLLGKLQGLGRR